MKEWAERLAGVDDDYLIGLSNKGIVKRAYKDKGEGNAEITDVGEKVSIKVGEETVAVSFPLGESTCTCPSRSMCRHIVQAILVLKERAAGAQAGTVAGPEQAAGAETGMAAGPENVTGTEAEAAAGPERTAGTEAETMAGPKREAAGMYAQSALRGEINAYPFQALKKALGNRSFQSLASQVMSGVKPQIQYASVVTVSLPDREHVVKLLSPLAYSSCTCHRKELCAHKAAAILWCQLEAGVITGEQLAGETLREQSYDLEKIRADAGQMKAFLEELLGTGLSRTSTDMLGYLERLAIVSHNDELPKFEGYFRALSDSYDRYLKRQASFKAEDLAGQIARLYRRVKVLAQAESGEEISKLAGEFKADYLPVGNLDLIGITMERFQSQTGYAGETLYFLEENTKKWYTYTNARPVFYDSSRKRRSAEKAQAPWGISLSFENLLKVRVHLDRARCDERRRLSSSQETRGEVTGERGLEISDIRDWYYRDFEKLFREQMGRRQREWLSEQGGERDVAELVFVQPAFCAKAEFSQTGQQLTLPVYDTAGRELLVEVTYSRQESGTIRYLERISEKKLPCFLGKIYLRDGRLRMYPVDVLDLEIPFEEPAAVQKEDPGQQAAEGINVQGDGNMGGVPGQRSKYEVIEEISGEILELVTDFYQSGFETVHDSTLRETLKYAKSVAQYGMQYLSDLLSGLAKEAEQNCHRMEKDLSAMAGLYTDINEYLYLCRQKLAYDRGEHYYGDEDTRDKKL